MASLNPDGEQQRLREEKARRATREGRIIFGGIGAFALGFITELSGGDTPEDIRLQIALYCCAFLIPMSIIGIQVFTLEERYGQRYNHSDIFRVILPIVVFVSYVAIGVVMWYFSFWMAAIYLFFLTFGYVYYRQVAKALHARARR